MQCEEFRSVLVELVDGELEAPRARAAQAHAESCSTCGSVLSAAVRDRRKIDAVVREAVWDLRPDKGRRARFVEKISRPPRRRAWPAWTAAAAAVLVSIMAFLILGRGEASALEAYRDALREATESQLAGLRTRPSLDREMLEDVVTLEAAALEDWLAGGEPSRKVSLEEAPRALSSPDLSVRAAAFRTIASAPHDALRRMRTDDPAAERILRAMLRMKQDSGKPEAAGEPIASIRQSTESQGKLRFVDFKQYRNGAIHLVTKEGDPGNPTVTDVWAHDIHELMSKHRELCQRFEIVGEDGHIKIGRPLRSSRAIQGDLDLARRSIVGGDPRRALSALEGIGKETFVMSMAEAGSADASPDPDRLWKSIQKVELDERLRELRSRVPAEQRGALEEMEHMYRRARRLHVLCESVRSMGN